MGRVCKNHGKLIFNSPGLLHLQAEPSLHHGTHLQGVGQRCPDSLLRITVHSRADTRLPAAVHCLPQVFQAEPLQEQLADGVPLVLAGEAGQAVGVGVLTVYSPLVVGAGGGLAM